MQTETTSQQWAIAAGIILQVFLQVTLLLYSIAEALWMIIEF